MIKKDISANLYQKCFILCSKIVLNVHYNLGLTILFPWQHIGFKTSPILKAFQARIQDFEMRGEIVVIMCNRNQSLVEVFEVCVSA